MKLVASMAILLLAAAPAVAQDAGAAQPYPIGSWAKLAPMDRKSTVVAAIEGVLLAATGPAATAPHVDQDCLSQVSIDTADASLLQAARRNPSAPFVVTFLEVTGCSRS